MKQGVKSSWILAAAAVALCTLLPAANATMVSTDQATSQFEVNRDRDRVQAFLNRAEAREKLEAMGIDAQAIKGRVARLTDQEAQELARKIETLPAGGDISNRNLIAILLVVLLVVLLV
jgi:hypothetical protein